MKLMVQPQDGVEPLIDGIHRARSPNSERVTSKQEAMYPPAMGSLNSEINC